MARPTSPAADFVRGLSAELTLQEMEAAAKKAGFALSNPRVWQIRAGEKLGFKRAWASKQMKNKKKAKKNKVKKVTARAALEAIPQKPGFDPAAQLRKLALQIGVPRIRELLRELEREIE